MEEPRVGLSGAGSTSGDAEQLLAASERKLHALSRIAEAIAVDDDLDAVLTGISATIAQAVDFPECNIYEYSEVSGTFRVLADYDREETREASDWQGRVCSSEESGVGLRALESGQPVVIASLDDPHLGVLERELMERFDEHVMVMLPMFYGGRRVGVIELCDRDPARVVVDEEVSLARAMAGQAVAAIENAKSLDSLRVFNMNSLQALASALKAKDPYTHGHASRVAAYAVFLCRELGIDARLTAELEKACYLHDIGKIGITDRILQKRGRLNLEERALMQAHATMSATIIEPLFSTEVVDAVRHHHEAWDGSGYPGGLQGAGIPLLARVLHLVDSYDAMSYSRPYARAMPYDRAREELERGAGRHFDSELVPPFLKVLEGMREMRLGASEAATEVADLIDGDEHARLVGRYQEDSVAYSDMVETLRRVRNQHPEVRYVTTAVLREDGARFILDAEEDPALRSHIGDPYALSLDTPLLSAMWLGRSGQSDIYKAWFEGEENVLYVDEWGVWVSGVAAIRNRRGETVAVVNVDVPAVQMASIESGAHRVFNQPLDEGDLQARTAQVLAITDELTGLYNHGYFQDQLQQELTLAGNEMHTVAALLIDLDGFRSVNERHGFAQGDIMLHTVGQALLKETRAFDTCARFGGAQFAVISADRELSELTDFAETLRRRLVVLLAEAGESATVSIGVAAFPDHAHDRETLLKAAHKALKEAKRQGKNRVAVAGSA